MLALKVENILKGSLDSIPSHSPSVKIQIMGIVNKNLDTKSLVTMPSKVLSLPIKLICSEKGTKFYEIFT